MRKLVDQAMRDGAVGVSTSLQYSPAPYAKTEELIALAREASKHGGIYATHMRSEGDGVLESIDEATRIGREAQIPVEIWHLKAAGKANWGKMPQIIDRINAARAAGVDVSANTYAYTAWFNTFSAFVPPWAHDGGDVKLVERLKDPAMRARIRKDMTSSGKDSAGEDWDNDGRLDGIEKRTGKGPKDFEDLDGDGICDGDNIDNIFLSLIQGRGFPHINLDMIALLCAMVAISGQGGLSNTPLSNYTRDQGWGMGSHVGAIPSVVGGHHLQLSHVGCVFQVTKESLVRWKRWYRHIMRDQLVVWMPACFIGLGLPSMLSVQFLPRGTAADSWTAAGMTASNIGEQVTSLHGSAWGNFFWFMTLFCGFLVLAPTTCSTADGAIRRWLDVFWTSSPRLRRVDPRAIGKLYFGLLCGYVGLGLIMLLFVPGGRLLEIAGKFFNYALGFSCWHALAVNVILLPRELRPNWFVRIALFLSGAFFLMIAGLTTYVWLAGAG